MLFEKRGLIDVRYIPALYLCTRELRVNYYALFLLFYNRYAIRESTSIVKIFKNFKEKKSFKPDFGAEGNVNIVV